MKATNLSLTVVSLFVVTNLPYIVDEFIRQKILTNAYCDSTFCSTVEVFVAFYVIWFLSFEPESSLQRKSHPKSKRLKIRSFEA